MKNFFFLLLAISFLACQSETKETTETSNTNTSTDDAQYFGAKITPDGAVPFSKMLSMMGDSDSLAVKVSGEINSVCQKKGCWMRISDDNGVDMLVQFQDYGFFMPKDASGQKVIIDGYAYNEVTDVKTLKHMLSDAGQPQEVIDAITEPQKELKFMANGVIIYK